MSNDNTTEEQQKTHWADDIAEKIIEQKKDQELITAAAGITPSGVVHIGNFREIITVDLIVRALKRQGKKTRFIYSWDDYDVFRKVPSNMPNKEMLEKHLRYSIDDTPDPFGEKESYAKHNEKEVEQYLPTMGIFPEFIHQAKKYKNCEYAEDIKIAIDNKDKIVNILDKYRKEPHEKDWSPCAIFCEKCLKDTTKIIKHEEYLTSYTCECGHEDTFDIRKKGIIKLVWRVDWPMRWAYENVDFEPSGKDHSSDGGSNTTAVKIAKIVWNKEPPIHFMYEFISIKGQGGKMSSSKGNTINLKEMLNVYSPELIRYLFASRKPEKYFEISFEGMDLIRLYSEFQKIERQYFGKEACPREDENLVKRIYELSSVDLPKEMPEQIDFRHLITVAQVYLFDTKKIGDYFECKNEKYVNEMVTRVKNWLENHAEEKFLFTIQKSVEEETRNSLTLKQKNAIKMIAEKLYNQNETELIELFNSVMKETGLELKEFFTGFYKILINKDFGPKLSTFMLIIGLEKIKEILEQV